MKNSYSSLIFFLALGIFGIITTEMGIIGVLPQVTQKFHITPSQAGYLVSAFALIVAISGPFLPILASGMNRKVILPELAQRLSPRSKKSSWTELNKERVRRLEKLGFMRDEGRRVLPDMDHNSFRIDEDIEQRLKEEKQVYDNFMAFPDLYKRVRIDTIQSNKNQPELFRSRLDK